jgi:hypothetical protein
MVTTRRSSCSVEAASALRRYELCVVTTKKRMMELCRVVEEAVRNHEVSYEKAERHYLGRVRAVNKMAYRYLNLSRMARHNLYDDNYPRIYAGSDEQKLVTKILRMFNTLSDMMFRINKLIQVNFETDTEN